MRIARNLTDMANYFENLPPTCVLRHEYRIHLTYALIYAKTEGEYHDNPVETPFILSSRRNTRPSHSTTQITLIGTSAVSTLTFGRRPPNRANRATSRL